MSAHCFTPEPASGSRRYARILWITLGANLAVFYVDLAADALATGTRQVR